MTNIVNPMKEWTEQTRFNFLKKNNNNNNNNNKTETYYRKTF